MQKTEFEQIQEQKGLDRYTAFHSDQNLHRAFSGGLFFNNFPIQELPFNDEQVVVAPKKDIVGFTRHPTLGLVPVYESHDYKGTAAVPIAGGKDKEFIADRFETIPVRLMTLGQLEWDIASADYEEHLGIEDSREGLLLSKEEEEAVLEEALSEIIQVLGPYIPQRNLKYFPHLAEYLESDLTWDPEKYGIERAKVAIFVLTERVYEFWQGELKSQTLTPLQKRQNTAFHISLGDVYFDDGGMYLSVDTSGTSVIIINGSHISRSSASSLSTLKGDIDENVILARYRTALKNAARHEILHALKVGEKLRETGYISHQFWEMLNEYLNMKISVTASSGEDPETGYSRGVQSVDMVVAALLEGGFDWDHLLTAFVREDTETFGQIRAYLDSRWGEGTSQEIFGYIGFPNDTDFFNYITELEEDFKEQQQPQED